MVLNFRIPKKRQHGAPSYVQSNSQDIMFCAVFLGILERQKEEKDRSLVSADGTVYFKQEMTRKSLMGKGGCDSFPGRMMGYCLQP